MAELSRIEMFWYSNSPLRWLLIPFSLLVQAIVLLKRLLYQGHLLKIKANDVPVIVVGNITVGGTGKTPFISYLVKQFQEKELKVGIVSRGYKSKAPVYPHIVNENDRPEIVGDEAFMQYNNLKVPMAIGADRAATVATLSGLHQLDVIISDDGLQHYAMARDFEILMVDANRLFGNRLMIPFGPLREPVARIGSVDYVIQNGENEIKLYGREKTTAIMNVGTLGLVNLQSNKTFPLSILKEGSVCAVAGIGNPQRFFNSLSFHCKDFKQLVFADHHNFNADDFYSIDDDMIVMTEKDAVKCREFAKANWYFLKIEAGLKAEDFNRLYNLIEKTLFKKA